DPCVSCRSISAIESWSPSSNRKRTVKLIIGNPFQQQCPQTSTCLSKLDTPSRFTPSEPLQKQAVSSSDPDPARSKPCQSSPPTHAPESSNSPAPAWAVYRTP